MLKELFKVLDITPRNTRVKYWRQPTPGEIKFGEGAIHYIDFEECFCWHDEKDEPKKWLMFEGLRYNRT